MTDNHPFHESNYQLPKGANCACPLVEVKIGASKNSIIALTDTGCSVGLAIMNNQIGGLDLGEKISDDPYEIVVADGHKIEADIYKADICLNGVKNSATIYVINPDTFTDDTSDKQPLAYLGRDFLDNFNVLFKGKEQKVEFYNP
jgi:hypothetical protein